MTDIIRTRKNLLGEYPPEIIKKSLSDLLRDSYFDKINSHPVYQRDIRWSPNAMNDFIGTVMNNGLVPGIIMYQLSFDERTGKNEGKSFEIVDGQHRLFTLKAFMDATEKKLPHTVRPFIVNWNYTFKNANGEFQTTHVFYKKTPEVEEWCRHNKIANPHYLTDEEKEYFENFGINITLIRSKITLDERREIFMSLQKGIPVRNSDLYKNKTECDFIAFITEHNYEELMTEIFFGKHCYKKSLRYWINWVSRLFLLYKRYHQLFKDEQMNNSPVSNIFLTSEKKINSYINKLNSHELMDHSDNGTDYFNNFDKVFTTFIDFLNKSVNFKYSGLKYDRLNPTQLYALFYVLCDESKDINTLLTYMPYLSKEGRTKNKKLLWECKDNESQRREYFNDVLQQLSSINTNAATLDERPITKSLKKQVWDKCVNGLCEICETEITEDTFEAGHIIARAFGGQTEIDNIIPICFDCNRSMGTQHAYKYKKQRYPHLM